IPSRHKEPTAIVSRGMRHFFVIPWRGRSLIGSSHVIYDGNPDEFEVSEQDIHGLMDEVNESYPALGLTREDIAFYNSGLVPYGDYYGEHSRVIDHARDHGVEGLVTVTGVRYTTSRGIAAKIVDLAAGKIGKAVPASMTDRTPVFGGDIGRFDDFAKQAVVQRPHWLSEKAMRPLLRMYGSKYREILKYAGESTELAGTLGESTVLRAEVVHAVREEMAQRLGDVVFRRTELGTAGHPGDAALQDCANLMAAELGWTQARIEQELDEVNRVFPWRSRVYS
ncbi:MAG: FAD-dependent oxidoreductase, partial [Chloroflexi bacterium]|nr:FAD-dependent oxidoreductase [Chloroflexota bacterium]